MGFLGAVKVVVMILAGLATIAASIHDVRSQRAKESNVSPLMLVGCVVAGLVVANYVFGKKSTAEPTSIVGSLVPSTTSSPQHPISIRGQQADEAAAAVAAYFRKADEEAWVEEQLDRAQSYFSRGKPSTSSKP
ncbi:MAG: hypothetical protein U0930_03680 [Pirellulales bacterium]